MLFHHTFFIMDKRITILAKSDYRNSGYVPGSMNERIAMVWPLTCEAAALSKKYDVEQRLQRHITCLIKQVLSTDDLIKNKRSTGRTKDLADAESLEERQRG